MEIHGYLYVSLRSIASFVSLNSSMVTEEAELCVPMRVPKHQAVLVSFMKRSAEYVMEH